MTAVDNAHGQWQYSTNGGANWQDILGVSLGSARLLGPAHYVRFIPDANFNSQIAVSPTYGFKVWDQTSGVIGGTANTTTGNAFSAAAAQATQPVTAVNDEQVLAINAALTVDQGSAALITSAMLETTDVDDLPAELLYTINAGPSHGTILVNGTPATQFSQQQINAGAVSYQNDSAANSTDSFDFTVDDGEGTATASTFSISIRPNPGDYDQNLIVEAADYILWRKTLGATGVLPYSGADGDGDTTIDEDDYTVWRSHFSQTLSAGSGATNTPLGEPVTAVEEQNHAAQADFDELNRAEPVAAAHAVQAGVTFGTAGQVVRGVTSTSKCNLSVHSRTGHLSVDDGRRREDALQAWLDSRDVVQKDAGTTNGASDEIDFSSYGAAFSEAFDAAFEGLIQDVV